MKKIVAKRITLIIVTVMAVILFLNMLIQRENAINHLKENSKIVIKQIVAILEKNAEKYETKEEVNELVFPIPAPEGTGYYIVEKETMMIVGNIGDQQVGKSIRELTGDWAVDKILSHAGDFYYFQEEGEFYIGVSQPKAEVLENVKENMKQLLVYLIIASCIMIFMTMYILDRYVIRGVNRIVNGVKEITGGELNTKINVEDSPEFKILSDNINQMTGSLLGQAKKITKILDTVDMLLAVYEYGNEGERVFASGKIGPVLMLSEEETEEILNHKKLFEQKIDGIKQYPVKGYKRVYQLPVETECFLQIETFRNEQSEFGVILDVTEEIVEKRRLEKERDYDLLTGLLNRRGFYQKMKELSQKPHIVKQAVLMMCDLDGLKKFNDTYGHANGDKAIKKAAEIMTCISDRDCYAARLSGDEFAIYIYGAEEDRILEEKIKEIYEYMMKAQIEVYGKPIDVRLSGGYVFSSKYPEEYDQLLKKADDALYISKENGRARFTEYRND